jgi:2-polyprenyl-6-methoxyphenol hydroxylase-like FAD-dependent oxidoreductase
LTEHPVLIAGAGPTGLMLAAELALAGVDVGIVEPRASQALVGSRARGMHSRTIEVLDQRGIADRFLSQGTTYAAVSFARVRLDVSDLPTRHNYLLGLSQSRFEETLAGWVAELAVPIHRGREVVGFRQDDTGVDVEMADGETLRAQYLVGCDGGRSAVRKAAEIDFPGWEPTISSVIADVKLRDEPELGIRHDEHGTQAIGRLADDRRFGVVVSETYSGQTGEPTLRELSRALVAVWGTDFGVHSPTWISRFTDMTRQAASYRERRVLLAGDAAHVHYPVGGQGLNLGVQDAVNLGWKLAQVAQGAAPDSLLDTYHLERHPVAARILQTTMAQTALTRSDPRTDAVRATLSELLSMDEPRMRVAAAICGLDVHYDLGQGHPLLGRRMPDLDLVTADGAVRAFALLHGARGVLLDFGGLGEFDSSPWADRVVAVAAEHGGDWVLPALGPVDPPPAVLVRPDGYVAWAGDGAGSALRGALTTWFGPR